MNREALKALIIRHEGLVLKPYKDTVGKLTIGVGRNLDDVGISTIEANFLLDNDLARVISECRVQFKWFNDLDDARQNVICSMVFNLGLPRFLGFQKMLAAIEKKDWKAAADEMMMSRWAGQVGKRASELAQMMLDGDTIH